MEFDKVIKERTATRKFQTKKVEEEQLNKILEAGRIAPTAKNIQPQRIYVIQSEEGLEKIRKASPCTYNAQTILLVCSNKEEAFHKQEYSTYEMDACIVATHMMLEATNVGVDNIWVEMFDKDMIKKEFELSDEIVPICLIPLGYRTEDAPTNPNHLKRKPLEELVSYC